MRRYVLAIDQGTTSTRAVVVDGAGQIVAAAQREHHQYFPHPGWVEHDAAEIRDNVRLVVARALSGSGLGRGDIAAVGLTNQRETTVVWDRRTGEPVHRAIVWQDTRTQPAVDALAADGGTGPFRAATGLPLATYFSATKIAWILDNVPGARADAEAGHLAFGTTDSWMLWNLTGGLEGGVHATDATNASRTLLMDLRTLEWSPELLEAFGIPAAMLPRIAASAEVYGTIAATEPVVGEVLAGVPVAGILGDQQAATFGQTVFAPGAAKNTYGTGCFMNMVTGTEPVFSTNGLLTTVAYRLAGQDPVYGLEGSIAVAGSLVQWLRDNLGIISTSAEVEELAASVEDNGGVYFVPAFSGLFAPHWRPEARGAVFGLTRYATRAHLARAALEATAFQVAEVVAAAAADCSRPLTELRVDGGMAVNDALMQFQADLLGIDVVRPAVTETTALGAAFAAGLAVGNWSSLEELGHTWHEERRFVPDLDAGSRAALLRRWGSAVRRTFGWLDDA
ncbi:glycerol kinase GlpK [Arthrobacter ginkgonis]|uniref:Glycerol kinase n=1 Tax=Arthrobacter ginkgonis TaxID=1630594 RepID=A0ABP7CL82_9MICC